MIRYIREYRQQAIKLYSTTLSMEIIDYIDTNFKYFNKYNNKRPNICLFGLYYLTGGKTIL